MSYMRTTLVTVFSSFFLLSLIASPSFAEEKSFYSPVIQCRYGEPSHLNFHPRGRVLD